MILQALAGYYRRLAEDGGNGIAPEGFESKEIPFLIILNKRGEFRRLQDTRTYSGKKLVARKFLLPKERERSGSKAWEKANLLWDHYGYVLAHPRSNTEADKQMALKQHGSFVTTVNGVHEKYPGDAEIEAVCRFFSTGEFKKVFTDPYWPDCAKIPGCNLSFRLEDRIELASESENVRAYAVSMNDSAPKDEGNDAGLQAMEGTCLVTGEYGPIERLHPRTPIPGAKSNAKIVSFQKNMGFDSYGKQQSFNAPTGKRTASAYTAALKRMLARESHQRIQVGDATTVFWAEKKHDLEKVFADIFGKEPAKGEPEQDYKSLIAMFRSPETGASAVLDPTTKFYVLGLSPNAARIAVRFWYAGTVASVANNIWQHFVDLEIVKSRNEWRTISLHRLLRSTALLEKDDNIIPNLAGDMMKAILTGIPYPQTLLASVLARVKAEQSKKDSNGRSIQSVNYTRAALIKAVLVRNARFYLKQEKEVSVSLDTNNSNPGYLMGRLFAVLEKAQEEASPNINATIRDRFYGAASSTPVAVFPHLMKLKNYHIAKLNNRGRAVNLEKQIGEIISGVDEFPAHLSLADQGRFAIGYYHQRQNFFAK